ncbi:AAA family ATPase [Sphaerospermopsis sp. FACHB-1094]|uniref:AAA family ATPase n=1 Tax=Sphaerospermopsis sp. FACHB-1094 TaxID=2692861 RepID=UPI001F551D91|nr:AAA family ATPase [Sphaerospermopsis sp. FACHB-1094]
MDNINERNKSTSRDSNKKRTNKTNNMLQSLNLHNFKSHKSTEFSFDNSQLHGLVGKNSAGKTSVLQALHNLSRLTASPFKNIFQYDKLPQFITTIGEKDMSVTASGFGVIKIAKIGKLPIIGNKKIMIIGIPQHHI